MNNLESAVRFMRPLYENWTKPGRPIPGIARMPPARITINNYSHKGQENAWKRVKRQRPNDNVSQRTNKALQNAIQLPGDGYDVFDKADYEIGAPVRKKVKVALEAFSSTWEERIRALE
jgi:hypothetical protein